MVEGRTIRCAYCGVEQAWPTAFPDPAFALCHACKAERRKTKRRNMITRIWNGPRGRRIPPF